MTKRQLIIIVLSVQLVCVVFGLLVWPGIWEYRNINGTQYRINRLTGTHKVFNPVTGFIDPTPTPQPKRLHYLGGALKQVELAKVVCDGVRKISPANYNHKRCMLEGWEKFQKEHEENEKEVQSGRAVYLKPEDYLPPEKRGIVAK